MPERWHYDKRSGLVYPVDETGNRLPSSPCICRGITPGKGPLIAAPPGLLDKLEALVDAVDDLIGSSDGVYGLHLNGDPAPWHELQPGGRFEEWLLALEDARAAIAKVKGGGEGG